MLNVTTFLNLCNASSVSFSAYIGARWGHTHESFPSFTRRMRYLYVGIGEEPVGKPSTKGFSGVGWKLLILYISP
jgi:hypothetical protein